MNPDSQRQSLLPDSLYVSALIDRFTLFDDRFFKFCFSQNEKCLQEVVQIFFTFLDLGTVELMSVTPQEDVSPLLGRGVIFDILATDKNGRKINVEVQRVSSRDLRQRARYYSAALDVHSLKKGEEFSDLKDHYVIFITEKDVFMKNEPIYEIERVFMNNHEKFNAGDHIIFVNGSWRGDDAVGRLMEDFSTADPSKIKNEVLSEMVAHFKISKEGRKAVESDFQKFLRLRDEQRDKKWQEVVKTSREEGRKEERLALVATLLKTNDFSLDTLKDCLKLTDAELLALKKVPS